MGIWQPGMHRPHRHLDRKGGEESQPEPELEVRIKVKVDQSRNVRRARNEIHGDHRHQHQHGPDECVEEKLETGIDPFLPAPDTDNQEHWNQARLEEEVEKNHVQRTEHTDHQRFHDQEGDHIFAYPHRDRFPARQDAERHQEGGKDNEQHRNAVHAHMIVDIIAEPACLFHKLERRRIRIKVNPDKERDHEGKQRCPERDPFRIAGRRFFLATGQQDQQHPDQGQECHR